MTEEDMINTAIELTWDFVKDGEISIGDDDLWFIGQLATEVDLRSQAGLIVELSDIGAYKVTAAPPPRSVEDDQPTLWEY